MRDRLIVGGMTGTSLDGLDLALVRVRGTGLGMTATLEDAASCPLGDAGAALRALASGAAMTAREIASASRAFSRLHAEAIVALLASRRCDLVCVHGQTVFHEPPVSWQVLTPAVIAAAVASPVLSDLRGLDLACGGQGAPITPIADAVLFAAPDHPRVIVNLGGFINITVLPPGLAGDPGYTDQVRAADVCACNQLLDAVARAGWGGAYDDGGRRALAGNAAPSARRRLAEALEAQARARRSLGTGDELEAAARAELAEAAQAGHDAGDIARAACEAIARVLTGAISRMGGAGAAVVLAGGGAHNAGLCRAIERESGARVVTAAALGVPIERREAMAMAVLGALTSDGVAITLPGVTGRGPATPAGAPALAGSWCGVGAAGFAGA